MIFQKTAPKCTKMCGFMKFSGVWIGFSANMAIGQCTAVGLPCAFAKATGRPAALGISMDKS